MKYIKQFSAAVLSFCMLLGIAPTTSAIYAASPISVYTQTDGLTTVRQISVADKNTLQSSTALFSAMGYTSAEANSISEADKTALLNSTEMVGNISYYYTDENGVTSQISEKDALAGATELNAARSSLSWNQGARQDLENYMRVICYTANIPSQTRRNKTIVTVNLLTDPIQRHTDAIGIAINTGTVDFNSVSGSMTYNKNEWVIFGSTTVTPMSQTFNKVYAQTAIGDYGNIWYPVEFPKNYGNSNYACSYSDFIITLSCEGIMPVGTSGLASHVSTGYYAHTKNSIDLNTQLSVTAGTSGGKPEAGVTFFIAPEVAKDTIQVNCPVYLEAYY